ncbi:MAG TPA: hypothetical protein VGJ15_07785 [Pirellulales bacterium]|jgi:hypothetical protein
MYYFLHRHRYWLLALVLISVVALAVLQMRGDNPVVVPPVIPPAQPQ